MTDLKTLKDIEESDESICKFDTIDELKAEAIKWVKSKRNTMEMFKATDGEDFMKFFNITEENLK